MAKNESEDRKPKSDTFLTISNTIKNNDDNSTNQRTEILYNYDAILKRAIGDFHRIKERFDNCAESTGPYVIYNSPVWKEYVNLKNRGIKLRFIIEITKDNISYCKELLKIAELRHLDGVKGNFGIADDTYYGGSARIKEGRPLSKIMRSNSRAFVEQQQFFFETLWSTSLPAEQKIKEIENGKTIDIWTKLLQDKDEIIRELFIKNSNADELSICTTIGGLEMSYNYLLDSYKNMLQKSSEGDSKGLRIVLNIDKDSVYLVKSF